MRFAVSRNQVWIEYYVLRRQFHCCLTSCVVYEVDVHFRLKYLTWPIPMSTIVHFWRTSSLNSLTGRLPVKTPYLIPPWVAR